MTKSRLFFQTSFITDASQGCKYAHENLDITHPVSFSYDNRRSTSQTSVQDTFKDLSWSFSVKMLTANYFLKKAPSKMFGRVFTRSLRLCFRSLFLLGIILNLEFHILAKTMFMGIQKGIQDSNKLLRWSFMAKCEQQIGPKLFKTFCQIYASIY